MKGILCLSTLYTLVALGSAANLLCYFNSWTLYRQGSGKFQPENIDPNLCTHLVYAFVGLTYDGSINILDPWEAIDNHGFSKLIALKTQNKGLKVLLSMGGWNENPVVYSSVAANPLLRKQLANNVVKFLDQYGFDGFDLAWEYPVTRGGQLVDVQNFVSLLSDLKAALGNRILSIDVAGFESIVDQAYDLPNISKHVDMINLMSYDFHGSYEGYVGHASALYSSSLDQTLTQRTLNVNSSVHHLIERGADAAKINLGIVTYGRGFTLVDPSKTALYSPVSGPSSPSLYTSTAGMLGFNEACLFDNTWQEIFDEEQQVPHIINQTQWIGMENEKSVEAKARLAKSLSLGGVIVWSLDTDDFLGQCQKGKYPLINKIKSVLQ